MINKSLLGKDKFIPEMHSKQPRLIYSACVPFPRNKERIKKIKKQEIPDIFIKMN